MASDIRHPLFARLFDRLSRATEKDVATYRDELLEGLSGRVVEIGPGNGLNFSHYPDAVDEVIAIEPEPYLREKAAEAAQRAPVKVTVRAGTADDLGLPESSADAAASSLVLCSVPDQAAALGELRRVLKPGAELRFLEHVRADTRKARIQAAFDATIWPRLAGGCHSSRDTVAAIGAAGFTIEQVKAVNIGPGWVHTNPHVIGRARLPSRGEVEGPEPTLVVESPGAE